MLKQVALGLKVLNSISLATGCLVYAVRALLLVMLGDALNLTANVSLPANIHLIWCYVATLMVILYHIMSS